MGYIRALLDISSSLHATKCIQTDPKTPAKGTLGVSEHFGDGWGHLRGFRGQFAILSSNMVASRSEPYMQYIDLQSHGNASKHCQSAWIHPAQPLEVSRGVFGCMWLHTSSFGCPIVPISNPYYDPVRAPLGHLLDQNAVSVAPRR